MTLSVTSRGEEAEQDGGAPGEHAANWLVTLRVTSRKEARGRISVWVRVRESGGGQVVRVRESGGGQVMRVRESGEQLVRVGKAQASRWCGRVGD